MRSPKPAFDLRAGLTEEVRAALDELQKFPDDLQAVHRCRVRVKRARALARVGRACAPGLSAVFVDSARALMRNLALSRDPIALAEAAASARRRSGKRAGGALETIAASLDQRQAALRHNAEAARAGLKDLLALAQVWPEASPRQIERGAKRLDRRARRARRRGRDSADPELRHKWRSREKDRLFAAAILDDAWPGRRRRTTARKIGDTLGAERDTLLLMERLAATPELAPGDVELRRALKALNRRRAKLARRADRLAKRIS